MIATTEILYSTTQAAQYCDVTTDTILNWRNKGKAGQKLVPVNRINGKPYYSKLDLDRFINLNVADVCDRTPYDIAFTESNKESLNIHLYGDYRKRYEELLEKKINGSSTSEITSKKRK